MTAPNWLIYGANGYTAELIAREAVRRGMKPILAGRNGAAISALATSLALDDRVFALDDPSVIETGIKGCHVVLHCAGPFSHTSKAMMDACLLTHAHYLDITGEIAVFETAASYDAMARSANIMLLPGVGFDVVPTDCLAAHLRAQLPTATHLTLAFRGLGHLSRGTTLTGLEGMSTGGLVRRDGRLIAVPMAWKTRQVDFGNGQGPTATMTVPWGDVFTAYYTTGIPNIEVYMASKPWFRRLAKSSRYFHWLLGSAPTQSFLKSWVKAMPPGPTPAQRKRSTSYVWGEVHDDAGRVIAARFKAPDGYTLTVLTALAIVDQVLNGRAPIGFQTPAKAYGSEWIFTIEGVTRLP